MPAKKDVYVINVTLKTHPIVFSRMAAFKGVLTSFFNGLANCKYASIEVTIEDNEQSTKKEISDC